MEKWQICKAIDPLIIRKMRTPLIPFFLLIYLVSSVIGQTSDTKLPRVFVMDARTLMERRTAVSDPKRSAQYAGAIKRLTSDAAKAMKVEIAPVTSKTAVPPSGDKHDYMSQAPYFWRNPDTKDGFPYIRRDGVRNPEILQYPDRTALGSLVSTVETLAFGYYFTGNEEYAARSTALLRMWFLDSKTKMNPHLEYGQAIPGLNTGRGIGIIETHGLVRLVDAVALLAGSKAWTKEDQNGLESWFAKYLQWLIESKNGRDEAGAKNNHGTIYDVQVASFAFFTGKPDIAKRILESAKKERIAKQVEPDGKQPLELARTQSWNYSTMNLGGFVELAALADNVGIDLWSYQTPDGRGMRRAFDYLIPFADGKKKWEYQQLDPLVGERLYNLMRRARLRYKDERFARAVASIPELAADATGHLLLP